MARSAPMLTAEVERYLSLRRALGYQLRDVAISLRSFASFADNKGDTYIRSCTVLDWAAKGSSPSSCWRRMLHVLQLARFLHAEQPEHEVPHNPLHFRKHRPPPYIYTTEEIAALVKAAGRLQETYPIRQQVYSALFGLIASTGLRISEALNLRLNDISPDGILEIRRTKFGKDRFVPLHPTAVQALNRYLETRRKLLVTDDHLFLSQGNKRIAHSVVHKTFREMCQLAGIASARKRQPRIHDLRHTLATRVLQQCATKRDAVARQFVALATYLGHKHMKDTYWYLEATPDLMSDIAGATERFIEEKRT